MQNTKGPAEAEPEIFFQQKRKWGSWFIVECFRRVASPRPYKSRVPEGVFLPDFLSTTFESTFSEGFFSNSLIFNELA